MQIEKQNKWNNLNMSAFRLTIISAVIFATCFAAYSYTCPVFWDVSSYGLCSATCDGGTQSRTVTCRDGEGNDIGDSPCVSELTEAKPDDSPVACNTHPCATPPVEIPCNYEGVQDANGSSGWVFECTLGKLARIYNEGDPGNTNTDTPLYVGSGAPKCAWDGWKTMVGTNSTQIKVYCDDLSDNVLAFGNQLTSVPTPTHQCHDGNLAGDTSLEFDGGDDNQHLRVCCSEGLVSNGVGRESDGFSCASHYWTTSSWSSCSADCTTGDYTVSNTRWELINAELAFGSSNTAYNVQQLNDVYGFTVDLLNPPPGPCIYGTKGYEKRDTPYTPGEQYKLYFCTGTIDGTGVGTRTRTISCFEADGDSASNSDCTTALGYTPLEEEICNNVPCGQAPEPVCPTLINAMLKTSEIDLGGCIDYAVPPGAIVDQRLKDCMVCVDNRGQFISPGTESLKLIECTKPNGQPGTSMVEVYTCTVTD